MELVVSSRGPYLLVATLPGEVEEARGEQLIFGPGITVHGVRACVRACQPCRLEESAEFWRRNGRLFLLVLARLPPASLSLCVRLSAPRRSSVPSVRPSGAVAAISRGSSGGEQAAASPPSRGRLLLPPSKKKKKKPRSGML